MASEEIKEIETLLRLIQEARAEILKLTAEGRELKRLQEAMTGASTDTSAKEEIDTASQAAIDSWFTNYFRDGGAGRL